MKRNLNQIFDNYERFQFLDSNILSEIKFQSWKIYVNTIENKLCRGIRDSETMMFICVYVAFRTMEPPVPVLFNDLIIFKKKTICEKLKKHKHHFRQLVDDVVLSDMKLTFNKLSRIDYLDIINKKLKLKKPVYDKIKTVLDGIKKVNRGIDDRTIVGAVTYIVSGENQEKICNSIALSLRAMRLLKNRIEEKVMVYLGNS